MKPVDKIWMNGELVNWDEARIHVLSHVVHYGYGVFEGIRCYRQSDGIPAIFRLEDHIRRLFDSAHILQLQSPYDRETWIGACAEAIRVNGLGDAYLRPVLAVGYGELGLGSIHNPPICSVAAFEWGAYLGEEGLRNGIRAKVSSFARHHVNSHMLKGKVNGMYVNNILAKREALDDGYDEAIMLDTTGHVVEASGENLFIVRDGHIVTPPAAAILAGITRDTVLTLLRELGHEVERRPVTRDELYIADEIFMCGTAAEVTPVREVDRRRVGDGKPGPLTRKVQEAYMAAVRGEARPEWLHRVT